ncbi:uncharacterized protein CDV56_102145 [Aspergillus thermomutatus]|uniref:Uncharacterized protein n=1 Tax=Aspergillus thermomutatus TaxID=41047 RepID=A0A397G4H8_ASPTH|nr:uncharacterized protein CDV56_102145 [Aspergillus thermomutatus]RHZ45932.1 hypothetical protein CDV56_102145 [Aspergillus thermomutatus]
MRLFAIGTILSIGIGVEALHYPESVPLHRRQDPGTPEYDCHANCGGVIVASRSDGYCSSDTFKSELKDCLGCALKYNIWQYYGDSVSKAATAYYKRKPGSEWRKLSYIADYSGGYCEFDRLVFESICPVAVFYSNVEFGIVSFAEEKSVESANL